jgi:hypothetical protein
MSTPKGLSTIDGFLVTVTEQGAYQPDELDEVRLADDGHGGVAEDEDGPPGDEVGLSPHPEHRHAVAQQAEEELEAPGQLLGNRHTGGEGGIGVHAHWHSAAIYW